MGISSLRKPAIPMRVLENTGYAAAAAQPVFSASGLDALCEDWVRGRIALVERRVALGQVRSFSVFADHGETPFQVIDCPAPLRGASETARALDVRQERIALCRSRKRPCIREEAEKFPVG